MLTLFGTLHHYNDLYMTEYGGKSPFTVLWRKEQPARYNLSAREILSQVLDKDNCMTYIPLIIGSFLFEF